MSLIVRFLILGRCARSICFHSPILALLHASRIADRASMEFSLPGLKLPTREAMAEEMCDTPIAPHAGHFATTEDMGCSSSRHSMVNGTAQVLHSGFGVFGIMISTVNQEAHGYGHLLI